MQKIRIIGALLAVTVLASGCSTRPRNFTASLSQPVADRDGFESDFRTCQGLVRGGRTADFKAAAATGLATGAGALGAGVATVGAFGIGSGASAAAAAVMPVVGIVAGFGVSRMIRSGKERKFKRGMASCLSEYGFSVQTWKKVHKRDDAAHIAAEEATLASVATTEVAVEGEGEATLH